MQIVSVEESTANFLGTKAEIKLKKAEPGAWAKLDIPRVVKKVEEKKIETPVVPTPQDDDDDDFDLDDLNLGSTKMTRSKEASNGRTANEIV